MAYNDQTNGGGASGRPPITRVNILEHLTDMIGELKVLAQTAEAPLLATILDLAQHEAKDRTAAALRMTKLSS
jgi:hypothetical protein